MAGVDPAARRDELDRALASHRARLEAETGEQRLLETHGVAGRLPRLHLADGLPTPVTTISSDHGPILVKRDDLTSTLYGGNKVRKLEFVLSEVKRRRCVPVIVGATASHQVLASVLYGRLVGVECAVVLFPQPPNPEEAVLSMVLEAFDVPVVRSATPNRSPLAVARALAARGAGGRRRCLVYPGSSSPRGTLGYVECGLEIADSVQRGQCPEPDIVYTAFGTGGTAVGLALGLQLGGLATSVCAVRVGEPIITNRAHLRLIEWRARRLLTSLGIPVRSAMHRISLETSYRGEGYGHPLPHARAATALAASAELPVDQTYTAKALAAALDHRRRDPRAEIMFLETLSAPLRVAGDGPGRTHRR